MRLYILLVCVIKAVSAVRVYTGTNQETTGKRTDRGLDKEGWQPVNVKVNQETWRRSDVDTVKSAQTPTAAVATAQTRSDNVIEQTLATSPTSPPLYKIKMTQVGYIQFLRYIVDLPALQDFTFCLWVTSNNLTYKHPILSYSKNEKERLLRSWIDPKEQSLNLYIKEEKVFTIPFHMKEKRWYHICESFSGYSGTWLVFVDGKKKGNGVIKSMQGTFVPGGGDLIVGQEYTDFDKGLDDGIEGEVFGFNLVDEAVTLEDDHGLGYTHYRPQSLFKGVPPFKKLPPTSRRNFHDIKHYIEKLPTPKEELTGLGSVGAENSTPETPAAAASQDIYQHRHRNLVHTKRYKPRPPRRKVVVYSEPTLMDIMFSKRLGLPAEDGNNTNADENNAIESEARNEKYFLHGYNTPKTSAISEYKIYENFDEGFGNKLQPKVYETPKEEPRDKKSNKSRRARYDNNIGQFSLNLTREGNRRYPITANYAVKYKPKYHFQTLVKADHRSAASERISAKKRVRIDSKPIDKIQRRIDEDPVAVSRKSIPVYEVIEDDLPRFRRLRRSTPQQLQQEVLGSFKKLPNIPEEFFRRLEQKDESVLQQYFPVNETTTTKIEVSSSEIEKAVKFIEQLPQLPQLPQLSAQVPTSQEVEEQVNQPLAPTRVIPRKPQFVPVPEAPHYYEYSTLRTVEFVKPYPTKTLAEPVKHSPIFVPLPAATDSEPLVATSSNIHEVREPPNTVEASDRLDLANKIMSSGTELVLRSYGQCSLDRGSPVTDRRHLLVAWSSTPVRIYGGALITNAKNICGYF